MADQGKARRQDTVADRIEAEFRHAVGGIATVERMRREYHAEYADNPSLQSFIDRVADAMRERLPEGVPEEER
jgi:hypothetical protein